MSKSKNLSLNTTIGHGASVGRKLQQIATPPANVHEVVYELSANFDANGTLVFQYDYTAVQDNGTIHRGTFKPLQMHVGGPNGTIITVKLKKGPDWRFTPGLPPVRFTGSHPNKTAKHPADRYLLIATDGVVDGIVTKDDVQLISIFGPYLGGTDNFDMLNLFIDVLQGVDANGDPDWLKLIIDPDIKNPGDNLFLPPPGAAATPENA